MYTSNNKMENYAVIKVSSLNRHNVPYRLVQKEKKLVKSMQKVQLFSCAGNVRSNLPAINSTPRRDFLSWSSSPYMQ